MSTICFRCKDGVVLCRDNRIKRNTVICSTRIFGLDLINKYDSGNKLSVCVATTGSGYYISKMIENIKSWELQAPFLPDEAIKLSSSIYQAFLMKERNGAEDILIIKSNNNKKVGVYYLAKNGNIIDVCLPLIAIGQDTEFSLGYFSAIYPFDSRTKIIDNSVDDIKKRVGSDYFKMLTAYYGNSLVYDHSDIEVISIS